jgi:hypothetical protein
MGWVVFYSTRNWMVFNDYGKNGKVQEKKLDPHSSVQKEKISANSIGDWD